MMNKRAFEIGFNLIFGIVVGAVIIFFAIYAATKLIKTSVEIQSTELGKEFGIILNPIETAFETGKSDKITLVEETRLFNDCKLSGTFGTQEISTASKSLDGEWQKPSFPSSFKNKYIFSDNVEGKNFFVFSKPFEMPFKIASLIYIWDENQAYCFIDPPRQIESDVVDLNLNNIFIENCTKESKKVCFSTSGCDIDVSLDISGKIRGSLKKKAQDRVYFENSALLYAAIFSLSNTYECQLKRLMRRTSELSWLYYSKTVFLSQKNCNSNLEADLAVYSNRTFSFNNSLQLRDINFYAEEIRSKNEALSCKLF